MVTKLEEFARTKIVTRLKELGLTTHEALSYITLLSQSSMSASALCKESGIPNSKIYYALDELSKKGMLIVQKGNPNIYVPVSPKEAIENLKQQLIKKLDGKLKEADDLTDILTPIYESAETAEQLEVAYIIRGQHNIISRMKALIETTQKEITIFIAHSLVLKELKKSLIEAKQNRKVKLNVAIIKELIEADDCTNLGDVRLLCCAVGLLLSDEKTLLTLSDWVEETAMLTQDKNLIQIARDYYNNPNVAQPIRTI
jgi:sugar-specific transcriptional regulator TrmB